MTIPDAFTFAVQHHQSGRLAEAEAIYRQILAADPRHPDALHLLGVIAHQVGRNDVAVELIGQAIALMPAAAALHSNLGLALAALSRRDEACAAYRRAIQVDPNYAVAHNNLGNALKDHGQLDEAVAAYRRAIELRPDYGEAHNNLGTVLREQGRLEEAAAACRRAVELNPNFSLAHNNLGNALSDQGRFEEAAAAYRRALELDPMCPGARGNLGNALREMGRLEEAIAECRQAIQIRPDDAAASNNLAVALQDQGRLHEAIAEFRRTLALRPDFAEAHTNLGAALAEDGKTGEAVAAFQRAIQLRPDYAEAHYNLGNILLECSRIEDAEAAYRRALKLKPTHADAWSNLGTALKDQSRLDGAMECYRQAAEVARAGASHYSNLVYTALFDPAHDLSALRRELARWSERYEAPLRSSIQPHANRPDPDRRLRVGYVSPNFSRHVICHFLTPLLEAHDHSGFEICCYSSVRKPDWVTERMKKTADLWRDVTAMEHESLERQVRADGIDILVDLTQHMANNRLPLFARKPAPVQVAWLGYPGSTGLHAMDYRLTDHWMEPEGAAWSESVETPVRLPDSWFCFEPIEDFPIPGELPALRTGHVTFGSLNNFCKINDAVLHRWVKVLQAIEGSRLLMQCPDGAPQARVRHFCEAQGIPSSRLELVSHIPNRNAFLGLFDRIDLALDPFPYNGGTSTCEALWMGIPVLTLPGDRIVSRIGLSILSACGMPEFVAHSEKDHVQLAAGLVGDLSRLARLRATLRARMKASPFMDAPRFARNVEAGYRQMWRAWCAKQTLNPTQ